MAWPQLATAVAERPAAAAPMAPPAPQPVAPPAPQPAPAPPTEADPDADEAAEDEADQRVHHHARIDADGALAGTDTIRTLCGLRLPRPRPDAARMPCCPRCAGVMGGRCR